MEEETYEELHPASESGGSTLKSGYPHPDNDAYMSMHGAPTPRPRPQRSHHDTSFTGEQQGNVHIMQSAGFNTGDIPEKKSAITLVRVKKAILVLAIFIFVCFLLSVGALALGLMSILQQPQVQSANAGSQGSNQTVTATGGIEDITSRVQNLEASLSLLQEMLSANTTCQVQSQLEVSFGQLQERLASLQENVTHASTAIARLQNLELSFQQLQVRVGTLQDNISSTPSAIASLSSRLDGFNEQLNTAFSAFSANDTRISAQLNAISSQLNATSTALTNVSGKVNAGVNLYRGCYMDSVSCRVVQHSSNEHWYLCSTPFLVLNATVSCVHE